VVLQVLLLVVAAAVAVVWAVKGLRRLQPVHPMAEMVD
jgi:hypothetical protein